MTGYRTAFLKLFHLNKYLLMESTEYLKSVSQIVCIIYIYYVVASLIDHNAAIVKLVA